MGKDVFLNHKRLEKMFIFAQFIEAHDAIYADDYKYPQLLIEDNSIKKISTKKNKISNNKICRIKNNKFDYMDIKNQNG